MVNGRPAGAPCGAKVSQPSPPEATGYDFGVNPPPPDKPGSGSHQNQWDFKEECPRHPRVLAPTLQPSAPLGAGPRLPDRLPGKDWSTAPVSVPTSVVLTPPPHPTRRSREGRDRLWKWQGARLHRALWVMVRNVDETPCGNRGPWNDASDSRFRRVILLLGEERTIGPMHGGRDTSLRLLLYP